MRSYSLSLSCSSSYQYCQVQFDVVALLEIQQVSASLGPNVVSCLGLFIIKSMAPTHKIWRQNLPFPPLPDEYFFHVFMHKSSQNQFDQICLFKWSCRDCTDACCTIVSSTDCPESDAKNWTMANFGTLIPLADRKGGCKITFTLLKVKTCALPCIVFFWLFSLCLIKYIKYPLRPMKIDLGQKTPCFTWYQP